VVRSSGLLEERRAVAREATGADHRWIGPSYIGTVHNVLCEIN
jgi:hypothetical protein